MSYITTTNLEDALKTKRLHKYASCLFSFLNNPNNSSKKKTSITFVFIIFCVVEGRFFLV